jgi:hypothetical protein
MGMKKKLNLMASNVIIICLCLFCGCKCDNKQIKNVEKVNAVTDTIANTFVPDSSINEKFLLNNERSLQEFYPNINTLKLVEFVRENPIIAFCNTSKSEYLFAYQYEGNIQNEFSCFEIGYYNEKIKSYVQSNYKEFTTENGLRLGLSLEEVERIKGKDYTKQGNKIIYKISDPNSAFLRNYNMPEYFLEFDLQQNKVVKIKFGFAYP